MPTAETTLFPAYSARSRRLLTSSVRLDNEPILVERQGALIARAFKDAVVEFIDENVGGTGVRLRKRHQRQERPLALSN